MAAIYPPVLDEEQLSRLLFDVKDYELTHGMLLKHGPDMHSISGVPVGVSAFPTLFPRRLWEEARGLVGAWNELYAKVAGDAVWLGSVLDGLIRDDSFTRTLWEIYEEVEREGVVQDISLGIFRSDYMIERRSGQPLRLKQVEFNTYSCAGGAHANKTADMHAHLLRTGALCLPEQYSAGELPRNETIHGLAGGLAAAHELYGASQSGGAVRTGVLMVVQPRNFNIADERPIEYALWDRSIPCYRCVFGDEVLARTTLTPTRELLFYPPSHSFPVEISVVYLRAGYEPSEYTPAGRASRLLLERARAIKCPSILGHLATFKKVQQSLAVAGAVERFLCAEDAARVEQTFAPMYPLDDSAAGWEGRRLAMDRTAAQRHVLKPSLEGGGHNVYGRDIPGFLEEVKEEGWSGYVLMDLIEPLVGRNVLVSSRGLYMANVVRGDGQVEGGATSGGIGGATISELGIFGVCIWQRSGEGLPRMLQNHEAGWSLKTKPSDVNEMSVVKGYGCFDCPLLVDDEAVLLSTTSG